MISFEYSTDFKLSSEEVYTSWINALVELYNKEVGELTYRFMSDSDLLEFNKQYLDHDTYTDIISFDYSVGDIVSGDILISEDRVRENSVEFGSSFHVELLRVMSHGVLHYLGFNDKGDKEVLIMRQQEEIAIKLFSEFHVEQ
jgi:rRNA maturation RNase YbeY